MKKEVKIYIETNQMTCHIIGLEKVNNLTGVIEKNEALDLPVNIESLEFIFEDSEFSKYLYHTRHSGSYKNNQKAMYPSPS